MTLLRTILLFLVACLAGPVSAQYHIRAGDSLRVEVLEDESLNRTLLVTPDGNITFPYAGTLKAAGLSAEQLAEILTGAIEPAFALRPTVFVAVTEVARDQTAGAGAAPGGAGKSASGMTIFFVGEFEDSGAKSLPKGTSFLQALAESGGFTKFAATKRLQLRRKLADGQEQVIEVNFAAVMRGKGAFSDFELREGDVILAPERRLFE